MFLLYVLSVLADTKYQLTFIMKFISELRIIKGSVRLKQGTFRLHKNYRLIRHLVTQFLSVISIVTPDTKYFHKKPLLVRSRG